MDHDLLATAYDRASSRLVREQADARHALDVEDSHLERLGRFPRLAKGACPAHQGGKVIAKAMARVTPPLFSS